MNNAFWKNFPAIPGFDCVEMKREAQARVQETIGKMTPTELVEHFNQHGEWQQAHVVCDGAAIHKTSEKDENNHD